MAPPLPTEKYRPGKLRYLLNLVIAPPAIVLITLGYNVASLFAGMREGFRGARHAWSYEWYQARRCLLIVWANGKHLDREREEFHRKILRLLPPKREAHAASREEGR